MLGHRNRCMGYRHFVEAGVEEEVARFYANQRVMPVLGDEAFRSWALEQGADGAEAPRWERERLHTVDEVLAVVAGECGVDPQGLTARDRRRGTREGKVRQLAMLLCRDKTELTLAAIGERFGGIHYSAVGQNIRRVQAAMQKDEALNRLYQAVMSKLDP
jgi:hypothetical protein